MARRLHKWTKEEINYLGAICNGKSYKDIMYEMNRKFEYDFTYSQIAGAFQRYNFKNGIDTTFKKGEASWNKGIKGNIPSNYKPIGSEIVDSDGFILIKLDEPSKWEPKQRYLYKKNVGPIKKGNVIIFLDGNKRNFDTDNLAQVTRSQLLTLNKYKLITCNPDLTKAGINTANLILKINEIKRGLKNDKR